jgi:5-methyltetrahydropteroyltriglutamate--homocysteine methyltransferase
MMATAYVMYSDMDLAACRAWCEQRVAALNHALRDIPREKIRWHTCYGINIGPRVHDVALADMVDIFLKVKAGAYSFEAANPRHEHEWRVWENVKLDDGRVLIPGVISHATNIVEHPELVAERIVRYAQSLGRENVIAGTDCGFAQGPFHRRVHPSIMWAKLESLAEGARLATKALWQH